MHCALCIMHCALYSALVVEGCVCTRIVDDAELLQRQRKRQMYYFAVFINKGHLGYVCPKPDCTSAGKEMRGQCADEDDNEGEV